MKEIQIKKYVRYLFGVSILLFILNKLYIRPWVWENEWSGFVLILTNSIPNLLEAIIGTLLLTGIFLQLHQSFSKRSRPVKDIYIHIFAVINAAIYVLSQELRFHNLGGNNVYDPYDFAASVTGLIGTFVVIQIFGFVYKK
ncbi:MAG: hypothetical protein WD361_12105 [Gracilimonas sp.]